MKIFRLLSNTFVGLCLISVGSMTAVAQNASVLYGTDGRECTSSTLYELSPVDGSIVSTIGATGTSGITGLASHPTTGVMYGITTGGEGCDNSLYSIDLSTGAATLIGPTGVSGGKPDAAFRADGVLFTLSGSEEGSANLLTVDLGTGAATVVGSTGVGMWDLSLCFDGGTLVLTDGDTVYTLDQTTGASTVVGPLGSEVNDSNMCTTDPLTGQVYLGDSDNEEFFDLYTLDTVTGDMVLLGSNTVYQMSAIEFQAGGAEIDFGDSVPVPTLAWWSLLLLALGLGVIGFMRYSRQQAR